MIAPLAPVAMRIDDVARAGAKEKAILSQGRTPENVDNSTGAAPVRIREVKDEEADR